MKHTIESAIKDIYYKAKASFIPCIKSKWYILNEGKIYLRCKIFEDSTITIATIEANSPGNGWFTEILKHIEDNYECHIEVENVLNERLRKFLINNGFKAKEDGYGLTLIKVKI